MDVRAAIIAIEEATGGGVCFHDFDGSIAAVVGDGRVRHHHPVCVQVKAKAGGRCAACDLHASQARLAREPEGFWKLCHAGLVEAYVPVRTAERNVGAVFLGPWRWEGSESPAWAMCQGGPRPGVRTASVAPAPAAEARRRILVLTRLLAEAVAKAVHAAGTVRVGRRERILRLVDERLHGPFPLAGLAVELGLSPSRCGHVVRDEFGLTFPALVDGRRLEQARRQLLATTDPVAQVARRCGYASASYFAKRFRRATGQSPEAFRRSGGA